MSTGMKEEHSTAPGPPLPDTKGVALLPLCAWLVPAHLPSWVTVTPSPGRRKTSLPPQSTGLTATLRAPALYIRVMSFGQ